MENVSPKITVISVSKLNKYIKNILEDDFILKEIFVSGEISNLKKHSSGHYYFTLKDSKCQINAVMFKNYTNSINFDLRNGMKVTVVGYVSIYEAYGTFQIYVENIFQEGKGSLSQKFEELKSRLLEEGYFEESCKKQIPDYIKTVAILTAKDGAAIKDIIKTIKRRNELIRIIIVPTIVQGALAIDSIVNNIKLTNEYSKNDKIDAIILGRGGGSIEDLWAFNEEEVVKAIFHSKIPIISAVGHETDFTLSDFVADNRASTPTAAAEMVSVPIDNLIADLTMLVNRLDNSIEDTLEQNRRVLNNLTSRNCLKRPETIIYQSQSRLQSVLKDLNNSMSFKYSKNKSFLDENITKLELLNPIKILSNGYTLTYKEDKHVKSCKYLEVNDEVTIKFCDGARNATIK